jgi:hypothetical protein
MQPVDVIQLQFHRFIHPSKHPVLLDEVNIFACITFITPIKITQEFFFYQIAMYVATFSHKNFVIFYRFALEMIGIESKSIDSIEYNILSPRTPAYSKSTIMNQICPAPAIMQYRLECFVINRVHFLRWFACGNFFPHFEVVNINAQIFYSCLAVIGIPIVLAFHCFALLLNLRQTSTVFHNLYKDIVWHYWAFWRNVICIESHIRDHLMYKPHVVRSACIPVDWTATANRQIFPAGGMAHVVSEVTGIYVVQHLSG